MKTHETFFEKYAGKVLKESDMYDEMIYHMDKFMPEDGELVQEFYDLLDSNDEDSLVRFIEEEAYGNIYDYMPFDGTIEGFVKALIG